MLATQPRWMGHSVPGVASAAAGAPLPVGAATSVFVQGPQPVPVFGSSTHCSVGVVPSHVATARPLAPVTSAHCAGNAAPPAQPVAAPAVRMSAPAPALGPLSAAAQSTASSGAAIKRDLGMVPMQRAAASGTAGTVLCIGDSLTKGINAGAIGNYPTILEGLLQDAGLDYRVQNAGVWGETIDKLNTRLPYVLRDAATRSQIKYILVLSGTNDLVLSTIRMASELVEKLQHCHGIAAGAPGAPMVGVLTMPPTAMSKEKEFARQFVNRKLREEVQADRSGRLFLVDLESVSFSESYDGLHYSTEGYVEFAQRALQAILPHMRAGR